MATKSVTTRKATRATKPSKDKEVQPWHANAQTSPTF